MAKKRSVSYGSEINAIIPIPKINEFSESGIQNLNFRSLFCSNSRYFFIALHKIETKSQNWWLQVLRFEGVRRCNESIPAFHSHTHYQVCFSFCLLLLNCCVFVFSSNQGDGCRKQQLIRRSSSSEIPAGGGKGPPARHALPHENDRNLSRNQVAMLKKYSQVKNCPGVGENSGRIRLRSNCFEIKWKGNPFQIKLFQTRQKFWKNPSQIKLFRN